MQKLLKPILRPTQTVEKKYYSTLDPAEFKHILNWELRRGALSASSIYIKGKVLDNNNDFIFTPKYGRVRQSALTNYNELEVFSVYGEGKFKKGDKYPTEVHINVKTYCFYNNIYYGLLISFIISLICIPFSNSAIVYTIISIIFILLIGLIITHRKKSLIKELENIVPLLEQ